MILKANIKTFLNSFWLEGMLMNMQGLFYIDLVIVLKKLTNTSSINLVPHQNLYEIYLIFPYMTGCAQITHDPNNTSLTPCHIYRRYITIASKNTDTPLSL